MNGFGERGCGRARQCSVLSAASQPPPPPPPPRWRAGIARGVPYVHGPEVVLRHPVALLGRLLVPVQRPRRVPRHARDALGQEAAEEALRVGVAQLRRFEPPLMRLGLVLGNTVAGAIHAGQGALCQRGVPADLGAAREELAREAEDLFVRGGVRRPADRALGLPAASEQNARGLSGTGAWGGTAQPAPCKQSDARRERAECSGLEWHGGVGRHRAAGAMQAVRCPALPRRQLRWCGRAPRVVCSGARPTRARERTADCVGLGEA